MWFPIALGVAFAYSDVAAVKQPNFLEGLLQVWR